MKRHAHAVWCVIAVASTSSAEVINVPADQPTIQAGIDAASDGDVVEVAPGTYPETIDFVGKAITLRSSHGRDVTTIDAQGAGSVVTCASGEGPDTVLEGFTITGGDAPPASDGGGGMVNSGSSPMVIDCTFIGNTAYGSSGGAGGGMANFNSSPTVTSCAFISNSAELGGGIGNFYSSSPTVTNCRFSGNMADEYGGGMLNFDLSFGSTPTVTNCTFSGNAAGEGGGMLNSGGGSPIVTNCILWGNTAAIDAQINSGAVTYTDVQGGYFGDTNIDADPLFVDPENGDLRVQPGSPCIDAGDNNAVPVVITHDLDANPRFTHDPCTIDTGDPDGMNPPVDMGAYEFQPSCPADLDCSGGVDVGELIALILAWGSCAGCPEDLNGDDVVSVSDLVTVVLAWGRCPVASVGLGEAAVALGGVGGDREGGEVELVGEDAEAARGVSGVGDDGVSEIDGSTVHVEVLEHEWHGSPDDEPVAAGPPSTRSGVSGERGAPTSWSRSRSSRPRSLPTSTSNWGGASAGIRVDSTCPAASTTNRKARS